MGKDLEKINPTHCSLPEQVTRMPSTQRAEVIRTSERTMRRARSPEGTELLHSLAAVAGAITNGTKSNTPTEMCGIAKNNLIADCVEERKKSGFFRSVLHFVSFTIFY